jgi:CzcA family heavy metal efflux pump
MRHVQNPGQFALAHSKLILFVVAVLAALGLEAYVTATQSMFPEMSFSRIDIVVDAGDLPPEQVRVAVTRPLEEAMQTLPSVLRVRGTSSQGSSELLVDFTSSTDPRVDLQYVEQAIAHVRSSIPDATNVQSIIVNANAEPVVSYALTSKVLSQTVLREFAQRRLLPVLYGTPGLSRLLLAGGPIAEYHVELDPAQLNTLGLSAHGVADAISQANAIEVVGTGVTHFQRYVFLIDASIHDAASLARIAIPVKNGTTVPLSSIAQIRLGVAPLTNQVAFDARHAVLLNAYALPGANEVKLAHAVAARLDPIAAGLSPTISLVKYWDQTLLVTDSQASLRDAILLGALLAVLVIFAFLRNVRMTLVAAAIIPLAMAIAVLFLARSGQSLNIMSVGGLAVAVGLIIDDAIVVIEAVAKRFAENPDGDPSSVISVSVAALWRPMLASTLTTVVVFVPLALLGGVTGFFFRALAFTLAVALLVSWTLATFVTPNLARVFLARSKRIHAVEASGGAHDAYEPVLRWALRHGKIVALGAAMILVVTVLIISRLPSDFLPSMNEGQFEIDYTMPPGLSLAATDAAATTMERVLLQDPSVVAEGRMTGIDSNGYSPTQRNSGVIRARLRPGTRFDKVSASLRDRLSAAVPAATLDIRQIIEDQINDLSGSPAPIEITLAGPSQAELVRLATRLADGIGKVPGIVDAFNGVVYDDPAIPLAPRGAQLAQLGIQRGDVASALSARAQGIIATKIPKDIFSVPVRVTVQGDHLVANNPNLQIFTRAGAPSLASAASLGLPALASQVNDENGQRLLRVTANINGTSLSSAIAGVKQQIAVLHLPPEYTATIGGAYQAQQQSFRQFLVVFAAAVTLVYAVMLATFGSLRLPVVILAAIPLALIGVALGLFLTGTPLNVSSFMGMLLLIGIVVKNGILLIDVAHKRRKVGDSVEAALVAAGRERLRPILMTTLAAIGGLLPLALGSGSGSEMQRPLAIAVIGGLSTATLFTLIVIPVLYSAVHHPSLLRFLRFGLSGGTAAIALVMLATHGVKAQALQPQSFAGFSLADAERAAITRSPDVAIAAAALNAARARLDQAQKTFGFGAGGGYTEAPQGNPGGPQIAARVTNVAMTFLLNDLFAHGPAVASALAAEREAQADVADAKRLESVKTIGLYFSALKAGAVLSARETNLRQAQIQLNAASTRVQAGESPQLDVVRAQVQVANARAQLALARAADANASDALERETGITALTPISSPGSGVQSGTEPSVPDAIAQAQRSRSDILAANEAVRAAEQAVTAARRTATPPVTLSAGYQKGADSGAPISGPTIGAQVAFPIPTTYGDAVAVQQAQLAQSMARVDNIRRIVAAQVGDAVRTIAASKQANLANLDALRAARQELRATETGYRAGALSSLDVTTARNVYEQAVIDALSSMYDLSAARATLEAQL